MNLEEIERRTQLGEEVFCPECDLFDDGECEIICCHNPFTGPSDLDIEDQSKLILKNYKEYYKNKEVMK